MIPVTKPFLPPKEEYQRYLDEIWSRNWLTNNGPLLNEFELNLKSTLGLKHLLYVSSGTMALQLAIKALTLKGEVITTPFSFVATTSSIVWEGCKPVFVDIDPDTLNIDPAKIENAITPDTSAILATHVFGNPCDVEAISEIADRHGLKVIYDAAHCFGTMYKGRSILEYGDISIISFHATKVFHTIEGGAVVTKDPDLLKKVSRMRNFGHDGPENFNGIGINGKNSEFHAAMGLCNLKYAQNLLQDRNNQYLNYVRLLMGLDVTLQKSIPGATTNYSYFPIIFQSEQILLEMKKALEASGFHPRRYFYPSLSELDYVESSSVPTSKKISSRVLCLPMYFGLKLSDQKMICRILLRNQNYRTAGQPVKTIMRAVNF